MKWTAPSRLQNRASALALLGLALVLAWLVLVRPTVDILDRPNERIRTATRLLASYRVAAATRPALEKTLLDLKARAASMPGLVQGDSSPVAAAQLQGDLKTLVEGVGGTIHSSQNLPPVVTGNYEEIALSYSATVPLDKLSDLLYALEAHTPYLSLSDLHIEVPESGMTDAGAGATAEVQWTARASRWAPGK